VAGLPAVDTRAVAKAWLLALVADAPLEDAAALPASELAREGPGLAGALIEALGDDTALARLAPGGNLAWLASRSARLAGATDPAGAIRAVEGLRRALTASLLSAARIDPVTTAELADRLAHVCSVVASAAATELAGGRAEDPRRGPLAEVPAGRPPGRPAAPDPAVPSSPTNGFAADPRPEPVAAPDPPSGELRALRRVEDPLEALRAREDRQAEAGSWRQAVERRLERHADDGSPFALLAIEVNGVERLLAAQEYGEVSDGLEALERALAAELRPADQLLREEQGRYWVTAPDTGPAVAKLLADRLAEAAGSAASHHGVPLAVSIGVAACPDDGQDADALAEHADQAVFAARAAGTPVA
jgi:GGDEF domain-containing protein